MGHQQRFGEYLVEQGIIDRAQLFQGLMEKEQAQVPLGEALVRKNVLSSDGLTCALGPFLGLDVVELDGRLIDPEVVKLVPLELASSQGLIPIERRTRTIVFEDRRDELIVAFSQPPSPELVAQLEALSGCVCTAVLCRPLPLAAAIRRHYYRTALN